MSNYKKRAPLLITALLMAIILVLPNILPSMAVFAAASSIQEGGLEQNITSNTNVPLSEGSTQPEEENGDSSGNDGGGVCQVSCRI